jgi:hypothetical protein
MTTDLHLVRRLKCECSSTFVLPICLYDVDRDTFTFTLDKIRSMIYTVGTQAFFFTASH